MAPQPLIFIADRSGLRVSPAELACIGLLAVAMFVIQDLWMLLLAGLLLGGFLFFARWGSKPVLRTNGDCLEYQNGKIVSRVKLADISGAAIKGNRFVGRSLVISGDVQVTVGDGKPVRRDSLVVADAFRLPLEDIRTAVAEVSPAAARS